jgi:hypothetical protein
MADSHNNMRVIYITEKRSQIKNNSIWSDSIYITSWKSHRYSDRK